MGHLEARALGIFGTTIPECGTVVLPIPTSPPTTPPYTLIVWPSDSHLSERYPLPLTGPTASWVVVYNSDLVLTLSVVDSQGEPVGYPSQYTVQATNITTACLSSRVRTLGPSPLEVEIDMPTRSPEPKTCDPLLIHIKGGQKPYHVNVIPAAVAPAVNITMGTDDDTLYWVNPFPPSTYFTLAGADSQGASLLVQAFTVEETDGGSNSTTTNCSGPGTHSYDSNNPNSNNSTASTNIGNSNGENNSKDSNGVRAAAIAGAVGGVMLLTLLFILFCRRKGRGLRFWGRGHHHTPNSTPDPILIGDAATCRPVKQIHIPSVPSGSRHYTKPPISSWDTGVTTTESMDATSSNTVIVAQERGENVPVSRPTNSTPRVIQHRDGGGVAEQPPAYREALTR